MREKDIMVDIMIEREIEDVVGGNVEEDTDMEEDDLHHHLQDIYGIIHGIGLGGPCKKGCTSIGNGNWGCQYPGPGPNYCWFASDCYGCGY